MRIIAGRAGGHRLAAPKGAATRPTSDRVREALFSAVQAWAGSFEGLAVLDLYAGSGALGLEAWSRGADAVTLVESDRRTAALIGANARRIGCDAARVTHGDVVSVLGARHRPGERYDEPAADALIVVERGRRGPEPRWPAGVRLRKERKYGETVLWYAERDPDHE